MKPQLNRYAGLYFSILLFGIGFFSTSSAVQLLCMANGAAGLGAFLIFRRSPRDGAKDVSAEARAASLAGTAAENGLKSWLACIDIQCASSFEINNDFFDSVRKSFRPTDIVWVKEKRFCIFSIDDNNGQLRSDCSVARLLIEQIGWTQSKKSFRTKSVTRTYDPRRPFSDQVDDLLSLRICAESKRA